MSKTCSRCGKTWITGPVKSIDGVVRWCVVCVTQVEGLDVRAKANMAAGLDPWLPTTEAEDKEDEERSWAGLRAELAK